MFDSQMDVDFWLASKPGTYENTWSEFLWVGQKDILSFL